MLYGHTGDSCADLVGAAKAFLQEGTACNWNPQLMIRPGMSTISWHTCMGRKEVKIYKSFSAFFYQSGLPSIHTKPDPSNHVNTVQI